MHQRKFLVFRHTHPKGRGYVFALANSEFVAECPVERSAERSAEFALQAERFKGY